MSEWPWARPDENENLEEYRLVNFTGAEEGAAGDVVLGAGDSVGGAIFDVSVAICSAVGTRKRLR